MANLTATGKILIACIGLSLMGYGVYQSGLWQQIKQQIPLPNSSVQPKDKEVLASKEVPAQKGTIIVNGSTALLPLVNALTKNYSKDHAEVPFTVGYEGTSVGFQSLIGSSIDVAAASRPAKGKETKMASSQGLKLNAHEIAIDAISMIVHPRNTILGISKQQLAGIYAGKITNWKQLGGANLPIVPYAREPKAGLHDLFKSMVLEENPYGAKTQYAYDTTSMLQSIINHQGAIGMATITQSVNQSKIKIIGISQNNDSPMISPKIGLNIINYRAIIKGTYPLTRMMYLYTTDKSSPLVQQFIDFAESDAGQSLVKKQGFIPTREIS
jgi:phosphate transport system substrate-binding protein